ncbi:hypothetical protein CVS40_10315 [Lucilia cuprina]|nr:hypothetical protein CVS40_10315 [Lucilia cuprina]
MTAVNVVLNIASKAGINIQEDDVDETYFLNGNKQNKKNKQNNRKSIVVKFTNKQTKQKLMREKSKLKEINELKNVFINDFLCKETLQLLNYAKSLKEVGFKFIYAKNGNIFAKKNEKSRQYIIILKTMDDVDELLSKTVGCGAKRKILDAINDDVSGDDEDDEDDVDDDVDDDDDPQFESPN